jgi:phospholipase C
VGDLRNEKGITWGWFEGGFKPSSVVNGKPVCATKTARLDGVLETAYSAHHEPFQYYASTSNRFHLPPTSVTMIGRTDQANHQYDLSNFWNAAYSGHLPAVSYLKATRAQDGHPSNSTPLDEQFFLVDTLNKLRSLPEWKDTAPFITWYHLGRFRWLVRSPTRKHHERLRIAVRCVHCPGGVPKTARAPSTESRAAAAMVHVFRCW